MYIKIKSTFDLADALTHWGRDKMDAISQTTFPSAFSWMKMFDFWLKFHWSLSRRGINNISSLVQIMAWRRPGGKPLSEPMIISLPTYMRRSAINCWKCLGVYSAQWLLMTWCWSTRSSIPTKLTKYSHCSGLVSYTNYPVIENNIRKWYYILKKKYPDV